MAETTVYTEGRHAYEFVMWMEDFNYSVDNVVIKSGSGVLKPGTPVGVITNTLSAAAAAAWGQGTAHANTGNGTCTKDVSAPIAENSPMGDYIITMTDATHFDVFKPGGDKIGSGVTGTAFNDYVKFVVATSTTPFIAGDGFKIVVTGASGGGKAQPTVVGASDGSQTAVGLILHGVDATSADVSVAALVRNAQVNGHILAGQLTTIDIAALATKGIIVRN